MQSIIKGIEVCRDNIDEDASNYLSYSNQVIYLPRLNKIQLYRANIPASSTEEYLKKVIYIPFLKHFIMEMKE